MKRKTKIGLLFLFDLIALYFSLALALIIRHGGVAGLSIEPVELLLFHFSFIYALWIALLAFLDLYNFDYFKQNVYRNYYIAIFFIMSNVVATIYFYFQVGLIIAPKTILLLHTIIFTFFVWVSRKIAFTNQPGLSVISLNHHDLLNDLYSHPAYSIKRYEPSTNLKSADLILFTQNPTSLSLSKLPFTSSYMHVQKFYEQSMQKIPIDHVDTLWLLQHLSKPEQKFFQFFKRIFDIFSSLICLVAFVVFFPFIYLAIRLDSPGSVFIKQKRLGKNGKVFTLYKFRTMVNDAEKFGPQWTQKNDPRVTRTGRVLRKLYLDELPQCLNILKGDLSFVGPRPERPEFLDELTQKIPLFPLRHLVKPGLTGWAQINYKANTNVLEAKEKLSYDLYYIKNRSLLLDTGILLKTIRTIMIK